MRAAFGERIGWKLFAGLMTWLFISGLVSGRSKPVEFPWVDYVGYPIELLALAGLITYAFGLRAGRPAFWRGMALVYPVWALVGIGIMFVRRPEMRHEELRAFAYVGATLIALLMALPTWIALRRLGTIAPS